MQTELLVAQPVNLESKLLEQTKPTQKTGEPAKQHQETLSQSHKVIDEHHGSYHVVHHHLGQHHQHYHHVEPALIIKPEDLIDPKEYLMSIHKMKEKVDSYYIKNTQDYINYWKRQYDVTFSLDGYQLIFYDIVINMEEFLKQDWRNVEYIGFAGSKIDDIKWRLFADHAQLFPNLKWLSLQIKHTINVKQGDLEKFKSLQRIQFNYQQWTHPLTIPSKNYLKQFAKNHQNVQVVFG